MKAQIWDIYLDGDIYWGYACAATAEEAIRRAIGDEAFEIDGWQFGAFARQDSRAIVWSAS